MVFTKPSPRRPDSQIDFGMFLRPSWEPRPFACLLFCVVLCCNVCPSIWPPRWCMSMCILHARRVRRPLTVRTANGSVGDRTRLDLRDVTTDAPDSLFAMSPDAYSVAVRGRMMCAHSFKGELFGPARALHGCTYVVDAVCKGTRLLPGQNYLVDICAADRRARP